MRRRSLPFLALGLAALALGAGSAAHADTPKRGGVLTSVKGLVAHNSLYNYGRMQHVWLDK